MNSVPRQVPYRNGRNEEGKNKSNARNDLRRDAYPGHIPSRVARSYSADKVSKMRRPCHRIRRAAFAPSAKILCELLQHRENTPFVEQRCAGLAPGSADRSHRVACPGRRASSPVRPNLSFSSTSFVILGARPGINASSECCNGFVAPFRTIIRFIYSWMGP